MTNFYEKSDNMTENFNTRLLGRFGMQDITPPPPPHIFSGVRQVRDIFTYPKPPFAAAKRWRPPHPSLILFAMMFMSACGGGGGGSTPTKTTPNDGDNGNNMDMDKDMDKGNEPGGGNEPMGPILPTGLFLRPTGEGNVRVYSAGEKVTGTGDDAKLAEETEGVLAEEVDGSTEPVIIGRFEHDSLEPSENKSGIPDLAVTYSLATTSEGDGYSNAMFSITDDTLSYIGANSGDYEAETRPTYKLKIKASVTIAIEADAANPFDYYYVSADDTQGGNGGVEYAYRGGAIKKTDVEAGEKRAGEAASVTVADSAGSKEDVLIITAKNTGVYANDINIGIQETSTVSVGSFSDFSFDVATQKFGILYGRKSTESVNLTLDELIDSILSYRLADIEDRSSGEPLDLAVLEHLIKGDTGTFADIFTIEKAAGADGTSKAVIIQKPNLVFAGGVDEITETVLVAYRKIDVPVGEIYLGDGSVIQFAAANNLRIDADSFVIVDDADGDGMGTVKVVAALPSPSDGKFYIIGEVKPYGEADPTQTGAKQSANSEIELSQTNQYDYVINLKDIDETNTEAESLPSAAEAVVPDTDDDPAAPEAEATKPSIGRRILDYLFGSQEEHRQMQNQQMDNMFSGDTLDPINHHDPDIL